MFCSTLDTPLGLLIIKAHNEGITFIGFDDDVKENQNELTELAKLQLQEYFKGLRTNFNLPLQQIGTEFQQKVWAELSKIEPGKPISYTTLSKKINNPLSIRAVASTNGKNKFMIVVPCHRVIGSTGDLVGYAGGLWRKKWLLEHEAQMMNLGQTTLKF